MHAAICLLFQAALVFMSFAELFTTCTYYSVAVKISPLQLNFVRFVCMTILHLSLIDDVSANMMSMKYAVNHPYKFESPASAFSASLMQVVTCLFIEITNDMVLIMTGDTLAIISNFVSLVIIASFDEMIYQSMKDESFRVLVTKEFTSKVFVIKHTTSKKSHFTEQSDVCDDEGYLRPLKVTWASRTHGNKCMYACYKVLRNFYVSIYFYYLPFIAMIICFIVP